MQLASMYALADWSERMSLLRSPSGDRIPVTELHYFWGFSEDLPVIDLSSLESLGGSVEVKFCDEMMPRKLLHPSTWVRREKPVVIAVKNPLVFLDGIPMWLEISNQKCWISYAEWGLACSKFYEV